MANFAKIGINGQVIDVVTLADADCQGADGVENEEIGRQYLERVHGWPLWKQTSIGTKNGQHYTLNDDGYDVLSDDQSKAFRGNFARIGGTYDEVNEIFWGPKPHSSWIKDETTYQWKAPVDYPSDENGYNVFWDEENDRWIGKDRADETQVFIWNPDTSTWSSL